MLIKPIDPFPGHGARQASASPRSLAIGYPDPRMLGTFLRGLRMLRHPELLRRLGEIWTAEREIEELRRRNPGARISSGAILEGWPEGQITLAAGSHVEHDTMIALGDVRNGYGSLMVGSDTWIGPYNNLRLAGGTTISIGAGCLISQFCTLVAANHDLSRSNRMRDSPCITSRSGVVIGDDVWLGAGSIILPGVHIASGAVIAAGSVVTHSVGSFEIWGGNPARQIGARPE